MKAFRLHRVAAAALAALSAGWVSSAAAQQTPSPAQAQTESRTRTETQVRDRQQIYGSQLMTRQERAEHMQRLRELKTAEEREQFRKEHHAKMKERAKERGIDLPDEPPARGMGAGPRGGTGPGAGPRGGPGR